MQKYFEKIKEKCLKDSRIGRKSLEAFIEIVNQVAEEYAKDTNIRSNDELLIHVMHGYDSLESPNGEMCFGCYVNGKHEIYVADDIPKEQFFQTIAHEYMHYLQDIEDKDFSEEEADAFAGDIKVGSNDGCCEWFKYDYRTIAPRNHDVGNPYWRTPEDMSRLRFCPYCGKEIKVVE